jgi:cyclomaltodextrinase / maltogenic alpha-amylase / neopullulanase
VAPEEQPTPDEHPGYVWQPPARGAWTPDWVRDAVFYQIFPDRFARSGKVPAPGPFEPWEAPPTVHGFKGGDLYGIAGGLDQLSELGVTALYLTPIFTSASNHRYHTDDYLAVDPLLGGEDGLRALLEAADEHQMRVVLDGVFNHTGRGHQPFVHVLENGASSPYLRWYHFDEARLESGHPLTPYVPANGDADDTFRRAGYQAWWGLPALPKLNHADPAVREFLYAVAEHWLRLGIAGWRLDVPGEIQEPGFWEGFRQHVKSARSDAYLVGEVWMVSPEWLAGDRFDALMDYPLTEAILSFVGGSRLNESVVRSQQEYAAHVRAIDGPAFGASLEHILASYEPAVTAGMLTLLGSHDTPRFRSVCNGDLASYRLATLIQMTLPGAPSIYYGDELGMEGGADPDCRRSYPADPAAGDQELRAFVKGSIALRRSHACLRDAGTWRVAAAAGLAYAHLRRDDQEAFLIAINAGETAASLTVDVPELAGRSLEPTRWAGWPAPDGHPEASLTVGQDGRLTVDVPPRDGLVLRAG